MNSEMAYLDFCNAPFMLIGSLLIGEHLLVLLYYLLIDNILRWGFKFHMSNRLLAYHDHTQGLNEK